MYAFFIFVLSLCCCYGVSINDDDDDDNVDLDTVRDVAEGEMLPAPEDAVLDAAGDLGYPDASTPSQMTDSLSATAGTSPSRSSGLLDSLSRRMVPSWLGWPGRGSARSDPVVVSGSLGQPRPLCDASVSVRTVDGVPDSARSSVQAPFVVLFKVSSDRAVG